MTKKTLNVDAALEERYRKFVKERARMCVEVICESCRNPNYLAAKNLDDASYAIDVNFSYFEIDEVGFLICRACDGNTSSTDLRNIAGRIKHDREQQRATETSVSPKSIGEQRV